MRYCSACFMPDTRPRITFNEEGVCNACQWNEEKKRIVWKDRQVEFGCICDNYRGTGVEPDCIVPWSGGKDSIYVAHQMRDKFGMTPLLVTVLPHLETDIGKWNREHLCHKFEKLEINLKEDKYRRLAKKYFIEEGRPKHPWECAISAVILNQSISLNLPFIIYGEEGEAEYGGVTTQLDKWKEPVSADYLMMYYWQNSLDWNVPSEKDFTTRFFTQYSRFENWSPSRNGNFATCKGMRTEGVRNIGTFTMVSQLSDKLQDLHAFLMYLKFGFGRCSSDVSIAIREGWKGREEGQVLIDAYDGEVPYKYFKEYQDYFGMSEIEFLGTLASHVNNSILEWREDKKRWVLKGSDQGVTAFIK